MSPQPKKNNIHCCQTIDDAFSAGRASALAEIKSKIGHLRQWLNEDRITDKKMVTNEEIETFLSLIEKEKIDSPRIGSGWNNDDLT